MKKRHLEKNIALLRKKCHSTASKECNVFQEKSFSYGGVFVRNGHLHENEYKKACSCDLQVWSYLSSLVKNRKVTTYSNVIKHASSICL